ncbi:recombinase family protein [Thiocapsa sp.]|uniref:recombinase family protein n=1 Tax=Thiocapsa sp. TaxID=2024551 RepID=UPI001BCC0790|nr:recombinase family protein [Thiocapsa sp.]
MSTVLSPVYRAPGQPDVQEDQSSHLQRQAVVYVRQSTLQQGGAPPESTRLQYALVDRAVELGWSPSQILLIDEDLGRSGASAEGRPGFQRLMAEVGLDHVGIVLGIEISRLARSSRDWYQLLEVCGLFNTLIGDADGIYDPQTYNDRLLLGLKGRCRKRSCTSSSSACFRGQAREGPPRRAALAAAARLCPRAIRRGDQGSGRAGSGRDRDGVPAVPTVRHDQRGSALSGRPSHPTARSRAQRSAHRRASISVAPTA